MYGWHMTEGCQMSAPAKSLIHKGQTGQKISRVCPVVCPGLLSNTWNRTPTNPLIHKGQKRTCPDIVRFCPLSICPGQPSPVYRQERMSDRTMGGIRVFPLEQGSIQ
jgi:hypothetical protein